MTPNITAAQFRALLWLHTYGAGRLDRYGNLVQDAAFTPSGQRNRSASQPVTFLRLILNGMVRARFGTLDITAEGLAALRQEDDRRSRQKLVKSANTSHSAPTAPAQETLDASA